MQTDQKILNAAYHCFMKFGYSATSIVMIGKYADVSRFTVHNYFKNKEEIFRAVVENYGVCAQKQCKSIMATQNSVWQQIEQATEVWFAPIFKDIADQIVFDDLSQAFNKYADDIRQNNQAFLFELFAQRLKAAEKTEELDLSAINKSAEQVAQFLVTSIHCIKSNIDLNYMPEYIGQMIGVYRVATQPRK